MAEFKDEDFPPWFQRAQNNPNLISVEGSPAKIGDGEVTRMGNGESYRPVARGDTFRMGDRDRSPPRRARTPTSDSWHPGARARSPLRRRSRTPPRRERSPLRDNWRARQRSPPRNRSPPRARTPPRRFSPRRDDDRRARSPPRRDDRYNFSGPFAGRQLRDIRRRSRSPYDRDRIAPRARSPLPRRSPPPAPRSYRGRSRSPPRRDERGLQGPSASNWRRRSPSPPTRESERSSGTSANTSRRSSPHIHPERAHLTQHPLRESRARSPPREREPERSPAQLVYRERDSARSTPRERSPPRMPVARSPPRGPASYRAPTGPSGGRNTAPIGPSTTSMSAHNRPENAAPVIPPAGPRGYVPPARGASYSMRGGRGSFSSERPIRTESNSWGQAPPVRPVPEISTRSTTPSSRPTATPSPSIPSGPSITPIPTGPSSSIPTGPRAGVPARTGPPSLQHSTSVYGNIRSNSIASTNNGPLLPRPHPAMANMPQIIPGGRIDPTMSGMTPDMAARLKRREEEAEVLREELHAKQEKLRQSLKVWDKLKANSAEAGLRSELSERHVRMLAGEGVGGAAF